MRTDNDHGEVEKGNFLPWQIRPERRLGIEIELLNWLNSMLYRFPICNK